MTNRPPVLVILAGGSNTRFWPLRGKSLFPFNGRSLLELQLETLIDVGFQQIVVVGNPDNHDSIERIGQEFGSKIDFRVIIQQEARGMGDALLSLRPLVEQAASPIPVYICQVHDVFERSLHEQMLDAYFKDPDATWLASYRVHSYFPGGYLLVSDDLNITSIVEKPAAGTEPSDLVNIVAHVHPDLARLLNQIEHEYATGTGSDDHYERAMTYLMKTYRFRAVPYEGRWHPIKYAWHVLDVMGYYLDQVEDHIADDASVAKSAQISGPVHISSGVKILDGATIVGPAYIGPNTLIGQYSHIRHSMIGEGCIIGLSSEVNRSYIGHNVMMHSAKALDSVLAASMGTDEHINLSAGVITANLRTDAGYITSIIKEDKVNTGRTKLGAIIGTAAFIGIGAMLMPGVKIGAHSIVGASTLVRNDIPDHTLFYAEQRYRSKLLIRTDQEE